MSVSLPRRENLDRGEVCRSIPRKALTAHFSPQEGWLGKIQQSKEQNQSQWEYDRITGRFSLPAFGSEATTVHLQEAYPPRSPPVLSPSALPTQSLSPPPSRYLTHTTANYSSFVPLVTTILQRYNHHNFLSLRM